MVSLLMTQQNICKILLKAPDATGYNFAYREGGNVTKAKDGKSLVELNQLTNFTNYNTPQPGGWLNKYN